MATISKAVVDAVVRAAAFDVLNIAEHGEFGKVSDRAYGAVFTDGNGVERMVELRAIVHAVDENMTARERLEKEMTDYQNKLAEAEAKKAEKERKRAEAEAKRAEAKQKKETEN